MARSDSGLPHHLTFSSRALAEWTEQSLSPFNNVGESQTLVLVASPHRLKTGLDWISGRLPDCQGRGDIQGPRARVCKLHAECRSILGPPRNNDLFDIPAKPKKEDPQDQGGPPLISTHAFSLHKAAAPSPSFGTLISLLLCRVCCGLVLLGYILSNLASAICVDLVPHISCLDDNIDHALQPARTVRFHTRTTTYRSST